MTDIDCHSEMTSFHREEVTLSKTLQGEMRGRRASGRTRLANGLDRNSHPQPNFVDSQGSYMMRTMVQDAENDYDIDDGAYFKQADLVDPDEKELTPLAARERVCDALQQDERLKHPASVKNNCVRQDYPEGYHIDVPVYRIITTKDANGDVEEYYELASGNEWVKSDARAVTAWFNDKVGLLNAGESDGSQMRRITKLTKKFARRNAWKNNTTSGICVTKLVVDHFMTCEDRDDKALRQTWVSIKETLDDSTEIRHPVHDKNLANHSDPEVTFFLKCLSDALKTLNILDTEQCTLNQAREAWDEVFDTCFFTDQPDNTKSEQAENAALSITSIDTARRVDGGGRFG